MMTMVRIFLITHGNNDDTADYEVPEHIGETVYGTFDRSHH